MADRPLPAYRGDEPYIFVCYSHEDSVMVYREIQSLQRQGFNIWWDEGIDPGTAWRDELVNAIKRSAAFLLFVTPRSVVSQHCLRELHFAEEEDRPFLAVHLQPTTLPDRLRFSIGGRQAILAHDMSRGEVEAHLRHGLEALQGSGTQRDASVRMSFLGEIKRRKVFQVGAVYTVAAWLAIQVITSIETPLGLPDWVDTLVIVLLAIGLPLTLVISWVFDVTPEGFVRDGGGDARASVQSSRRKIEYVLIGLLVIAVGWIGYSELGPSGQPAHELLPNSIAVLPFENLSPDPDNAYFARGIHEEILSQLAKIRDLNVIARTSVLNPDFTNGSMSIPAIALALNVETIMEGSVRYSGNRDTVRVTAQLIDGETNTHIWTDTFDGDLTDFFGFQTEIAIQIASATQAEFSADERERIDKPITNSPEAYALYLKARAMRGVGFASSPEYYQILDQAIALDPNFAGAHAVKAIGYGLSIRFDIKDSQLTFAEMRVIAIEHTGQALAIDPDLGLAHMAQAFVHYNNQHGTLAKQALERALQLSPNDVGLLDIAARTLSLLGDHNEAVRMAQRAVDLASYGAEATLAGTLWYAGNPVAAAESFREHIDLDPLQNRLLGAVEFVLGNNAAAVSHLRRFEELSDIDANVVYPDGIAQLAYQYGRLGLREDARRIYNVLQARRADGQYIATASRAISHLAIGDVDKAYQLLGEINGEWSLYSLSWMKSNILNDPVLEEPRFVELRSRIGVFD